jgi:hypothetical protein
MSRTAAQDMSCSCRPYSVWPTEAGGAFNGSMDGVESPVSGMEMGSDLSGLWRYFMDTRSPNVYVCAKDPYGSLSHL